ncbi:MAG: hemolysin family protein [Ghiorsea sp.]
MSQWQSKLRKKVLNWLRPGQTVEELMKILQRAECIHSDEQRRMLVQAVDFHETRVREIMTPRSHIHALDISLTHEELEQEMLKAKSARLPVTDGDLDHIVGVVHLWDLFSAKVRGKTIVLRDFVRPCPQISELQRVAGLLTEMREGSHIAVALDEFGGTAGLVTLPDLLEEIVGSIDEGITEEDAEINRLENGDLDVMGKAHIEDVAEALDIELPEGDFDTVAGLITSELGRIPLVKEHVQIAGLKITILEAEPRRIIRLKIHQSVQH